MKEKSGLSPKEVIEDIAEAKDTEFTIAGKASRRAWESLKDKETSIGKVSNFIDKFKVKDGVFNGLKEKAMQIRSKSGLSEEEINNTIEEIKRLYAIHGHRVYESIIGAAEDVIESDKSFRDTVKSVMESILTKSGELDRQCDKLSITTPGEKYPARDWDLYNLCTGPFYLLRDFQIEALSNIIDIAREYYPD